MWNALRTYEALTPNQLAACERCVAPDKQRAAERVADAKARLEDAPSIDISKIETAFTAALENLLKFPKLRLDTFEFSRASAASKNAGALYVKEGETYLGKIQGGKLICTRQCDDKTKARVIEAAADPHKAAKAYGMRTGSCSCCGRELTNGESIDLGIGPICAGKYGWGGRRAFSPDGGSHA